jgi:hypothetical protein
MSAPHFGIIPRRVAGLRLPGREHAVLDVIAVHADKHSGKAYLSLERIARETGLHKRKVPARICRLVDKGVIEIVQRGGNGIGGRGRANVYRIIPDEEASQPAAQADAEAAAEAEAVAVNGALQGTEAAAENGALFGSETVPFSAVNGALQGTPTEIEQNLEQNLPFGEGRPRTREEEVLRSRSGGGRQTELLLPLNGTKQPSAAGSDPIEAFLVPPEIVAIARGLGIDDIDSVVENWKDWHRKDNKPCPANLDASLRRWVRNELRFVRGSPKSGRSSLMKAVLEEAETDD